MSNKITDIKARQIIDSRGNPTIEADVFTASEMGRFSVPSGASTGIHEALELRDNNLSAYLGKGVTKAVKNVTTVIKDKILGLNVDNQEIIDQSLIELDGTKNKTRLGANAILAVSVACLKCAAKTHKMPLYRYLSKNNKVTLPVPMMNILNGGVHADNKIDFQEFMVMPIKANSFSKAIQIGVEIFHHLKKILHNNGFSTNVGDEGGFAPNINSNESAIEFVIEAIKKAGYLPGEDVFIALDAACSEIYDKESKHYTVNNKKISSQEMIDYWSNWVDKYPIISIEDGLDEDDFEGWKLLTKKLERKIQLVGDDLFVTSSKRLQQGIDKQMANSILIKLNQIGTFTETYNTIDLAHRNQYTTIISHRSGETEDNTIADIAVGLNTKQIKTGSLSRSDRTSKYNQLLRIEEELGKEASYAGLNFRTF